MTFVDRLEPASKKRLLALDGGGIRGVISLEILHRIEELLRDSSGNPDLVLADYFDYVAGTSTGAIIAACIASGMSIGAIREFYLKSGPAMFSRAGLLRRFRNKFTDQKLAAQLQEVLGQDADGAPLTLGDAKLRTLLMMVLRNATTDSPWTVSNNPRAKYNDRGRPDCNLNLPLWQLVRASTAAPTYFPPEMVQIGERNFVFVDGGVTTYNNPAFQLFLMSTLAPYKLAWNTGADRMLLVSVGTGASPAADANLRSDDMTLLYQAGRIPAALMYAALNQQDLLCRVFGRTLAGGELDRELYDLQGVEAPGGEKLFTYLRYNAELNRDGLAKLGLGGIQAKHVQALDSVEHIPEMRQVGEAVARTEVKPEHFAGFAA